MKTRPVKLQEKWKR